MPNTEDRSAPASQALSGASDGSSLKAAQHDPVRGFFLRNGFDPRTRVLCEDFARATFAGLDVAAASCQGYCSYTVNLGEDKILQFRPAAFGLDGLIVEQARLILSDLVPRTDLIGSVRGLPLAVESEAELRVYLLDRLQGVTLAELQKRHLGDEEALHKLTKRLVRGLGKAFAKTYLSARVCPSDHVHRGRVGSSLAWRLQLLRSLPSKHLRDTVDQLEQWLPDTEALTWCITHGDLVASNILIDPSSGHLTGLIDWAEGEQLPFGVGLYGLEEVLGAIDPTTGLFEYYPSHQGLREEFWRSFRTSLKKAGCSITEDEMDAIRMARKLGIMLWRGIAFEDGRIDRVVLDGVDDEEMHKLRLFMEVQEAVPEESRDGVWA